MGKRFYLDEKNHLVLKYYPEITSVSNMYRILCDYEDTDITYNMERTFHFSKKDLTLESANQLAKDSDQNYISFIIGEEADDKKYIKLIRGVFELEHDFYFDKRISFELKLFAKERASVVLPVSNTVNNDIYVDYDEVNENGHISIDQYNDIISKLINGYAISLYKDKMNQEIVQSYFDIDSTHIDRYEKYIGRKLKIEKYEELFSKEYYNSRIKEYKETLEMLKSMLAKQDIVEEEWQKGIADILHLIYPKYLFFISKFSFKSLGKIKQPDFIAIDNDGNVDIIEIKKANIGKILRKYRDNYVPISEISCACVQIEQYIYYMMSNKEEVEREIQSKYNYLIGDLKINIINPRGILIAGEGSYIDEDGRKDFEVAKRMYNRINEIITYDLLIKRIENTINVLTGKISD